MGVVTFRTPLLDRGMDPDHNRAVLSFVGEPEAVDSIIKDTKRVKNCRRGIPRGNNWSMTSRRSAS